MNIKITQEMRDKAYAFAIMIEKGKNQYARLGQSEEELIETTYIGKLGELAFLKALNSCDIFPDISGILDVYEGQENVDSYDFITQDGLTVDIKTGYLPHHTRLMVNKQQFNNIPKDIYVGIKLLASDSINDAGKNGKDVWSNAEIHGWISHDDLKEYGEFRNFGKAYAYAIIYCNLNRIELLLDKF